LKFNFKLIPFHILLTKHKEGYTIILKWENTLCIYILYWYKMYLLKINFNSKINEFIELTPSKIKVVVRMCKFTFSNERILFFTNSGTHKLRAGSLFNIMCRKWHWKFLRIFIAPSCTSREEIYPNLPMKTKTKTFISKFSRQ